MIFIACSLQIKSGLVNGLGSAIGGTVLGELLGGGNSTKYAVYSELDIAGF
jgi:hypothetical protein